ncbi:unnamed protein product [Pieris brassicae]|uniref:Uncharacterized protein n=1 Tax=Pieris brassicae TaxID=7116 RepID=A0A9P0X685_PIEBR|nr:unnamed protein product [Pieris brassicae]
MEFTDLNEESCKKSRRVRSWYLYEQFKSLEKSQLDAARKLKDRPYQERVLHKELNERRSRRRLCDQFGLCQSETGLGRNGEPSKTLLSTSTGDFYESFCKLHNDEGDIYSCDDSQSSKTYQECRVTYNDDLSHVESVASVIQNFSYDDNLTDNVKEDLQSVQRNINIAEDINLQLEAVKENLECIEKYTKMCEEGQISEGESFDSVVTREKKNLAERRLKTKNKSEPFISPVKFSPSEPKIDAKTYKNVKYRNAKIRKPFIKYLPLHCYQKNGKRNHSEGTNCRHNIHDKSRGQSEPRGRREWRSLARLTKSVEKLEKCSSFWPNDLKSICKGQQMKCMMDSMVQLSQQLDNVIREVESVNCS